MYDFCKHSFKTTRPLFFILLTCVLTSSQMFPNNAQNQRHPQVRLRRHEILILLFWNLLKSTSWMLNDITTQCHITITMCDQYIAPAVTHPFVCCRLVFLAEQLERFAVFLHHIWIWACLWKLGQRYKKRLAGWKHSADVGHRSVNHWPETCSFSSSASPRSAELHRRLTCSRPDT